MTADTLKRLAEEALVDAGAVELRKQAFPKNEAQWSTPEIDAARNTREPQLARALLALEPFVKHAPGCLATVPVNVYAEKWKYGPCECGLDAALAALDAKEGAS